MKLQGKDNEKKNYLRLKLRQLFAWNTNNSGKTFELFYAYRSEKGKNEISTANLLLQRITVLFQLQALNISIFKIIFPQSRYCG